jgi:HlyD family secretion protein
MSVDKDSLNQLRIDRSGENRQRSPLLTVAVIGVAILVIGGLALTIFGKSTPTVTTASAQEIRATARGTVLNASGYVTARRQATVSSKVTGRVSEVLVEEGMAVRQGELLARLDSSMALASLQLSQAQQEAARRGLEETRVRIAEARLDLQRATRLADERISSQAEADRAEAQLKALQARLVTQEGELAVASRQLALRRQDLSDTEIRAPFDAIVVSKNAQPGEMISPMSAGGFTRTGICTIVDMDSLEIEVDVNEAYINRVRSGQPVEAVLDAYPDWKIPAHVITVVPTADRQKATVRVRIGFDARDERTLPDMGVKVAFIEQNDPAVARSSGVQIPRAALRRDGEQDIVFTVKDGVLERRAVSVGSAEGDRVRITAGVSAGEQVVTGGDALQDGKRVRIAKEKQG